jgi:hypothetical protein
MTHDPSYRRILNRMGYYNYHNALINRHLNQEGGWDSHLVRSREFIMKALDLYKPDRVTVLGSGWLLELPIAEMIEKDIKVRLVDIIHPPDVISQAAGLKNVELIETDITGGLIENVWREVAKHPFYKKLKSLESINIPEYQPGYDTGMVLSLNLLTQLEYLLVLFLKKQASIKEEELSLFKSEIQKKHIDFLIKYHSVLISDISETITKKSGQTDTFPTLATNLPPTDFREEWSWSFDKAGSDNYTSSSLLKVVALTF